jgi:hypothetical protein
MRLLVIKIGQGRLAHCGGCPYEQNMLGEAQWGAPTAVPVQLAAQANVMYSLRALTSAKLYIR